jgi:hypothetical protein
MYERFSCRSIQPRPSLTTTERIHAAINIQLAWIFERNITVIDFAVVGIINSANPFADSNRFHSHKQLEAEYRSCCKLTI